jgi:hypothetical protein
MTSQRAKERVPILNAAKVLRLIMDTCCPHCEYDEAEGGLVNHCSTCARKIVGELHEKTMKLTIAALSRKRKKTRRLP